MSATENKRTYAYIDQNERAVVVGSDSYKLDDLPPHSQSYAALRGLQYVVMTKGAEGFAGLKRGDIISRRAKAAPGLDPWRQAAAHALVEATKKTSEPLTLSDAEDRAKGISTADLWHMKTDPKVVQHWRKLTGADHSVTDILRSPEVLSDVPALAEGSDA